MEWEQLAQHLGSAGLATLATASSDGRPHVSIVSPAVEDDVLWFGTWANAGKVRNLAENPQVALMWRPGAEIYLRGSATLVPDVDEKRRVWDLRLFPYDQEGFFLSPDNPDLLYVRVRPYSASMFSQTPVGLSRKFWRRDE